MASRENIQLYFFLILIALAFVLAFFIFKPFIPAIFLAVMFAVVFYPIYKIILFSLGGYKNISALVAVLLILVIILLPVIFFGFLIFEETTNLYLSFTEEEGETTAIEIGIGNFENYINEVLPAVELDLSQYLNFGEVVSQGLGWIVENLRAFFTGFVMILLNLFLMVLAMFYLFRDGRKFVEIISSYSPLPQNYNERILGKLKRAVNSVVVGRLLVGIIQGIFIFVGFVIFGIPNPTLWAFVVAIFSVLPLLGPMFIVVPAAAFLYFVVSPFSAIGLFVWGLIGVALIDEYLGSVLVDRGMKIHPFIILISILGGIFFMGPIGFVAGPVVIGLLFALLDIYPMIIKPTKQ